MKKLIALLVTAAMFVSLGAPALAAANPPPAALEGYPGIDELPAIDTIPDPFKFFDTTNDPTGDGYVSTPEEWNARREEIKDLVQHYWLGYKWDTAAEDVSGGYLPKEIPNTLTFGGFWGMGGATINPGDEFTKLVAAIQSEGVTVGENTYGPEADADAAQALAIEAWNAGYSVHWVAPGWFGWGAGEGDAVMKDSTGEIDADTIPGPTKIVYYNTIVIENPDNGAEARFEITVSAPSAEQKLAAWGDENALVPFVIDIGGAGAFSAANLNPQGYALVSFTPTDIYPDDSSASDGISRDGVYTTLYPYNADEYEYASGALMAWAWGVSQIITAMEQPSITDGATGTYGEELGLDSTRTVVTGHSRYGKAAMFAAAFDDRISICCPSEPGGSGIQSNRYKVEGKIFNWNTSYYPKADRVYGKTETPTVSYGSGNSWFPETAEMFVNRDNQIPFDSDEIIALVAPRPFFVVSGIDTHWLGNEGGVASVLAAAEVYDYIGATEIEKTNIAIRCRQSDHQFYPQDFCFALAIMDREFKQDESDTTLHVQDLFPNGKNYSSMSYPAADYDYLNEITSHPFEIASAYMPWSNENKYVLWTAQDNFLTDHDVTITANSNAPDVELYTPDGTKISASSHDGEEFIFELSADQAIYGRYELRTVGSEKENRSVYFSAISLSDALRHGTTKGDEGEENRVLGFSSRLANTSENPPVVYINGEETTMSFTAGRMPEEETTLMSYGIQFHDKLFSRIADEGWDETGTFSVKNLQFVTLPDYTFEFSMADIYASSANSGKEGAAKFTKAISWPVERYNNGDADVWPPIPNTLEERQTLASGGTVTRPEAPEAWTTDFDAQIVSVDVRKKAIRTAREVAELTIQFSEPLNTGEYAFGFDLASNWTTSWNDAGDILKVTFTPDDLKASGEICNMIIFRLMDLEGNLISGPIELSFTMPRLITFNDESFEGSGTPIVGEPGTITLNLIDAETGEPIPGARVKLCEDGALVDAYTADKDGVIVMNDVAPGDYTIVITYADGYELDGEIDVTVLAGRDIELSMKVAPKAQTDKPEEPDTPLAPDQLLNAGYRDAYVSGYEDGTIRPEANITRAEVAALFFRILSDEAQMRYTTNVNDFSDVGRSDWYNTAVSTLSAMGVINGYPDGTFAPNAKITRAEFAAIAAKFADVTEGAVSFNDISGHWAAESIRIAAVNGWISGYEDGTFRPDKNITRAEAMAIINRMLGRSVSSADALPEGMNSFSDNLDADKWYYLDVQAAANRI